MTSSQAPVDSPARQSLRERKQQLTREQILQACVEIQFVHGGYEDPELFTYAKVAELAGVSERTVYRMFPTKRDLVSAVIADRQELMGVDPPTSMDEWPATMREIASRMDARFVPARTTTPQPGDDIDDMPAVVDDRRNRDATAIEAVRALHPELTDRQAQAIAAAVHSVAGLPSIARTAARWDLSLTESADAHAWAVQTLINALKAKELDYGN